MLAPRGVLVARPCSNPFISLSVHLVGLEGARAAVAMVFAFILCGVSSHCMVEVDPSPPKVSSPQKRNML